MQLHVQELLYIINILKITILTIRPIRNLCEYIGDLQSSNSKKILSFKCQSMLDLQNSIVGN